MQSSPSLSRWFSPNIFHSICSLVCVYVCVCYFGRLFGCSAGNKTLKIIATVAVRSFMVSSSFNPLNKVLAVRSLSLSLSPSRRWDTMFVCCFLPFHSFSKKFRNGLRYQEFLLNFQENTNSNFTTHAMCVLCVCVCVIYRTFLPHIFQFICY